MEWDINLYVITGLGGLFFASALYALFWSVKKGQLANFEQQSKSVFDEEEPEGVHTDFFPGEAERSHKKLNIERGVL